MATTLYPKSFTDDVVKSFITTFFKLSDTPAPSAGVADPYVESFTPTATLKMPKLPTAQGSEAITETRQKMWANVVSRCHVVEQVYPYSASEVFLKGTVRYGLKDGSFASVDWSSNMVFDEDALSNGKALLKYYQVYLF
ncbi:uncharacterized protein SAPINGB_P006455 [Magnusiomyces paraingens]|uniref:SnoaL-like domain-containing protein n=1 Tax=Magnusiomyces paraingens TaxID=2606893 RepID=A0A5E8C528_9ASCO|nr:uncharacterized protein SAPINGB_P006455 [Saprochaete ingens]VVT58929.1 unnamed protein product [Saprochaete ingens]